MSGRVAELGKAPPGAHERLDAPAFHRNHVPIWVVLAPYLAQARGHVLEVGSGSGQHAVEFARRSGGITWWPSDLDPASLRSIAAWRAHAALANVRAPLRIDLAAPNWDLPRQSVPEKFLAIFCANVLHISPWRVAQGLVAGAPRRLARAGRLFVYGPFKRGGRHSAPSNAAFDASLRRSNPEWGVRDLDDVGALAERAGLPLADVVAMPANNLTLVFGPPTAPKAAP
jgi:SAM-dependent methyltransferase